MSPSELRRAVERPTALAGLEIEPELVDALVDDVVRETGGLPLLSTALVDLWHERDGRTLTLEAYDRTGGVRGGGRPPRRGGVPVPCTFRPARGAAHPVAVGRGRRRRGADAAPLDRDELGADDDVAVDGCSSARRPTPAVADETAVEVVHEARLERWPRLVDWIEEDSRGHRLRHQLAAAAAAWDGAGRDTGELMRGARLAATLDWSDDAGAGAVLNRVERDFLAASRTASTRETRRLRVLLAAAVTLLLAALVAGGIALAARGSARRQATSATAQRLGAQALSSRHSTGRCSSPEKRFAGGLGPDARLPAGGADAQSGGAGGRASSGQRVVDDVLDPSGRTLAVRGDDGASRSSTRGRSPAAAGRSRRSARTSTPAP
jgi:hypothetical protein